MRLYTPARMDVRAHIYAHTYTLAFHACTATPTNAYSREQVTDTGSSLLSGLVTRYTQEIRVPQLGNLSELYTQYAEVSRLQDTSSRHSLVLVRAEDEGQLNQDTDQPFAEPAEPTGLQSDTFGPGGLQSDVFSGLESASFGPASTAPAGLQSDTFSAMAPTHSDLSALKSMETTYGVAQVTRERGQRERGRRG